MPLLRTLALTIMDLVQGGASSPGWVMVRSLGRMARALGRYREVSVPNGTAVAMYVPELNQTWACVIEESARLIVARGHCLDRIDDVILRDGAVLIDEEVFGSVRPARDRRPEQGVMDAAFYYGRWHVEGRMHTHRVDAMYVRELNQTWACVQKGGSVDLVVIRGNRLRCLSAAYNRAPNDGSVLIAMRLR